MYSRVLGLFLFGLLAACSVGSNPSGAARPLPASARSDASAVAAATPAFTTSARATSAIAGWPDRGDLLHYDRNRAGIRAGAYTWHPVELSEAYALRAIAEGELRITAPDGRLIRLRYVRHIEHPDGNWTWIGRPAGAMPGQEAIITFGAKAVFGTIPYDDAAPLRLTMTAGRTWLVESDRAAIASMDIPAVRPRKPDFLVPPAKAAGKPAAGMADSATATATALVASATTTAATVDVVLGYTTGFASRLGGPSQAVTRLTYTVDLANQAYVNSQIDSRLRLVSTVQVNYTDANSNEKALFALSGVQCTERADGSLDCNPAPVPPALQPLLDARSQYGADLVSLVRKFTDPENDGCGLAWIIGSGQTPITAADADAGLSVVSDSSGTRFPDGGYFCEDDALAHELGHNMGSVHDRDTADGDDDVLQPNEYGRYAYSFGYKSASGNFHTVMAHGDSGQTGYLVFSNPSITFCGGRPCGAANQADNARSLRQTMPVVAGFRASVLASDDLAPGITRSDINGDGYDDLFYRNGSQFVYWLMHGKARLGWKQYTVKEDTDFAGYGDFDGNGQADLVWIDANLGVYMWLGSGSGFLYKKTHTHGAEWTLAGVADCNGDGRDDLMWYSPQLEQFVVWFMNGFTKTGYQAFTVPAGFRFVGSGDFNGDGKGDLLWDNAARNLYMWIGSGNAFSSTFLRTYQSGWSVIGTRDINGDGQSDIQWRNQSSAEVTNWLMDGPTLLSYRLFTMGRSFQSEGSGDFNGDGFGDLIWRNDARELYFSFSTGNDFSNVYVATNSPGWSVIN